MPTSKSWRDDPDLVRADDEDDLAQVEVDPDTWGRLFMAIEALFAPERSSGFLQGAWRAMFKGFVWQAKKRVAADPAGSRAYVVESLQVITAALRVEPRELYPDLKPVTPKEPAVA